MKKLAFIPLLLLAGCVEDGRPCLEEGETATIIQVGDKVPVIDDFHYGATGHRGPSAAHPRTPKTEGGGYIVRKDTFLRLALKDHIRVCAANGIATETLKVGDKIKGREDLWLRRVF